MQQDELIPTEKSPLMPERYVQGDFFVCDVFDASFKSDQASMEHPFFTLSKNPDTNIRKYENGRNSIEFTPSAKGMPNVFDRDILIYCISQIVTARNQGKPVTKTIRFKAHDLLIATNRDSSGRGYRALVDAFTRLQGALIKTNIVTGNKSITEQFSMLDYTKIIRVDENDWDSRMEEVEIQLSDWLYNSIDAEEILTIDRNYFRLSKPLERRLYEIARKHCGNQSRWIIGLEKLHFKTGSQSAYKKFKEMLNAIITEDAKHNHIPEYRFEIKGENVEVTRKEIKNDYYVSPISTSTIEYCKSILNGRDVYGIEQDWREWVTKKKVIVKEVDRHFIAFCKRRISDHRFVEPKKRS